MILICKVNVWMSIKINDPFFFVNAAAICLNMIQLFLQIQSDVNKMSTRSKTTAFK